MNILVGYYSEKISRFVYIRSNLTLNPGWIYWQIAKYVIWGNYYKIQYVGLFDTSLNGIFSIELINNYHCHVFSIHENNKLME